MKDKNLQLVRVSDPEDKIARSDSEASFYFQPHMLRIGSLIHRRRLKSGMSRIVLAEKTGVSEEKIEAIEELGFNCAVWDLMMIIDELGIADSELTQLKEV